MILAAQIQPSPDEARAHSIFPVFLFDAAVEVVLCEAGMLLHAAAASSPVSSTSPSKLLANVTALRTSLNWRRKRLSRPGRNAISNRDGCIPWLSNQVRICAIAATKSTPPRRTSTTCKSHLGKVLPSAPLHSARADGCNERFCRNRADSALETARSAVRSAPAGYRHSNEDIGCGPEQHCTHPQNDRPHAGHSCAPVA